MTLGIKALYDKAFALSGDVDDNFLELGKYLRQLQDRDPEMFQKIVVSTNLGRRKAYYLVEVSRAFDPLPIPRSRLRKIGWTKLQLIGKHVTPDNLEELLQFAEENNAKELERHMRGRSRAMSDDSKTAGGAHEPEVLIAPEGVEFTVTTYVRSDSTYLEIVNVRDGLTSLPLSDVRDDMDANALVAAWNDGKMPLGATDWRFMTRAEIAEHGAAEEIDVDGPDGNGS